MAVLLIKELLIRADLRGPAAVDDQRGAGHQRNGVAGQDMIAPVRSKS